MKNNFANFQLFTHCLETSNLSPQTKINLLWTIIKDCPENEKELYKNLISQIHTEILANNQLKQCHIIVPKLEDIKKLIEEKLPLYDENRLIGLIYCWWPLRDDLQIIFLGTHDNYLTIDEDGKYLLTISKSKKIYQPISRYLPDDIKQLMEEHIKKNCIKKGEYIFGKGKKSWRIARLFKKIGLKGSINVFRRAHRANALESNNKNLVIETAHNSFHSLKTASHYNTVING